MASVRKTGKRVLTTIFCMAIVVWSVLPATSHTPTIIDTLQEHAEMIAEHGHSHGFEEDFAWASHGHSHDSADHDHNLAVLTPGIFPRPRETHKTQWRPGPSTADPWITFLIERPPRV